ncbi:hypothetical protein NF681_07015 [Comamonadaceae bacterium OTU4NAUVB1]|nr:hypothetical protein NF681_07015 [Comamonadaceae bacterium OTU4NAUVB1]
MADQFDADAAVRSFMNGAAPNPEVALRSSLYDAVTKNPDQAAEWRRTAATIGVPVDTAQALPDWSKQQIALQQINPTALARMNPATTGFLTDPQNAAVAHDDVGVLSQLEGGIVGAAKYLTGLGDAKRSLPKDLLAGAIFKANQGMAGVLQAAVEIPAKALDPLVGSLLPSNPLTPVAEYLAWAGATSAARAKELSPATDSLAENAFSSGVQSMGFNLSMLPLLIATRGAGAGPVLTMMSANQGGQSYQEARTQGLSPFQALPYAASQAAIEYATEKLPLGVLLKDLKAGTGLMKTLAHNVATEIPGEQVATVLQDLNSWAVLPENRAKPFSAYLAERPSAAASTLIATVVGSGGQVGVMKAVQAAADRVSGVDRQAQEAQQSAQQVEQMAKVASTSKLRARDPESFRLFVDQVTEANAQAPKEFYIDAQTLANTLNQSGIGQAEIERLAPGVAAQMKAENQLPGADIRIPIAELLAADPAITASLIDHLRVTPEDMSRAESQQFTLNQSQELQSAVEGEMARAVTEADIAGRDANVRLYFEQQLAATNRFTAQARLSYASMFEAYYRTQAERSGMTPEVFLDRYRLEFTNAAAPGGRSVSQGQQRGPRATLSFGEDITAAASVIGLGKNADLSSVLHEGGHFFLEVQSDLAGRIQGRINAGEDVSASERQIAVDMGTLLKWMGVTGTPTLDALTDWQSTPLEQKRSQHEKFARGVETYFMEGQAPSVELQSVFDRFRSWLVSIYKKLSNLKADLSPDVRGVLDRMLASDDAIRAAEDARNLGPLYTSAEQAGMTPADFQAYQALGKQATADAEAELSIRMIRDMRLLSKAKDKALRAAQKEADALRAEIEQQVRREVLAEPIYRAHQFLTGKAQDSIQPGKIAPEDVDTTLGNGKLRTALVKEIAPEAFAELRRMRMTSEKEGMHPDLVADMFGFSSGDQLLQGLAMAGPPADAIQALTDQRMLETHGDIASPEALMRAAERAIANEARARMVATELRAAARAGNGREGSVDVMSRAARDFAERVIAGQRIKDVRPKQYMAAAGRSAKLAMQSLGNTAELAMHKRNELVNIHAARAASNAQTEIEAAHKYFQRVVKADIPSDYMAQIDALLERFDMSPRTSNKAIERRKSLRKWVDEQRELGRDPDISEELLDEARRVSVKDLTVDEFRGLVETVKQIEHLGRTKERMLTAKDERDFAEVSAELIGSVTFNAQGRKADTRTPKTELGRKLQGLRNFGASHIKVATLARVFDGGKDGGAWWERVIRPVNEAGNMETRMKAELTEKLTGIMAPLFESGASMTGNDQFFPTIGRSLNRQERMAIAMNWGNASNRQRLLGGENWTEQQVQPVLDSVTAEEWHVVQNVWSLFESLRPLIAAKELRVFGKEPNWIEPTPFVTSTGVTMSGGYFPVTYDSSASIRAEEHANAEEARQQMKGAYNAATTRRSFTKTRAEEVYNRPLLLSFQGMYGSLNAVVRDLAYHEVLIDLNRLLRSDAIDGAVRSTFGPAVIKQFSDWRNDIAEGDVPAQRQIDKLAGAVRRNVSFVGLGYNVVSAATQLTGVAQSIARVGPQWFGMGLKAYLGAPIVKTREASAKSEFMASRTRTQFRELAELNNKVNGQSAIREAIVANGYVLMSRVQQMVDVPTWHGAYEKAIADGRNEATAVQLADQSVIDAQGGGGIKDLSAIERGGQTQKLFTSFYSFMNTALNILVARGMTHRSAAHSVVDFTLIVMVPSMITSLLKDALIPGDGSDDDKAVWRKLVAAGADSLFGLVVGGRELSEAAKKLLGVSDFARGYSGPAGLRIVGDLTNLSTQVQQGDADLALLKATINVAGDLVGLPAAQINRTLTGGAALAQGDTQNPAALAFGYQKP